MAKESKNIQPESTALTRKGVKHANVQIYCLVPMHKSEYL
jgi:hypothetical protein